MHGDFVWRAPIIRTFLVAHELSLMCSAAGPFGFLWRAYHCVIRPVVQSVSFVEIFVEDLPYGVSLCSLDRSSGEGGGGGGEGGHSSVVW